MFVSLEKKNGKESWEKNLMRDVILLKSDAVRRTASAFLIFLKKQIGAHGPFLYLITPTHFFMRPLKL